MVITGSTRSPGTKTSMLKLCIRFKNENTYMVRMVKVSKNGKFYRNEDFKNGAMLTSTTRRS